MSKARLVFDDISKVVKDMTEVEANKIKGILKKHRKTLAQKSNGEQT